MFVANHANYQTLSAFVGTTKVLSVQYDLSYIPICGYWHPVEVKCFSPTYQAQRKTIDEKCEQNWGSNYPTLFNFIIRVWDVALYWNTLAQGDTLYCFIFVV